MYIKKQKNIKKTRYRQKPLDLKNAEGLEKHTQSVVLSIGKSAPVAQGIEHRPPEAGAAVRIRPGVYFFYYFLSPCVHNELSVAGLVWRESYESKDS